MESQSLNHQTTREAPCIIGLKLQDLIEKSDHHPRIWHPLLGKGSVCLDYGRDSHITFNGSKAELLTLSGGKCGLRV